MVNYIGFHGTTVKSKEKIYEKGFVIQKSNLNSLNHRTPNDLGVGIYFFTEFYDSDVYRHALNYVKRYKNTEIKSENTSACCVKATVQVEEEFEHLNFDEPDNAKLFYDVQRKYKYQINSRFKRARADGAKNRKNIDGYVVEMIIDIVDKKAHNSVKLVTKSTFTPLDEGNISNFPNGKEMCVRVPECIQILERE